MTASFDVGVFAGRSPRVRLAIRDALHEGFRPVRRQWHGLGVALYDYIAPPYLLDHIVLIGQIIDRTRGRPVEASGCSINLEAAVASFVGELVERTAAVWFRGNEPFRTASELELRAAGQAVFGCRAHLGTPLDPGCWTFRPYDPAARYRWLAGEDLTTGQAVWIPAALVVPAVARSDNLCEVTSVGTAAATSLETATERAVAELYERDALRISWFFDGCFPPGDQPRRWAEVAPTDVRLGWSTRFCTLPATGGGAGAVVFTRHRQAGVYAIGSSCSPGPEQATTHALAEAMQGRLMAWLHRTASGSADRVRTYLDHVLYRGGTDRLDEIEALFTPERTGSGGSRPLPAAGGGTAVPAPPGAVRVRLLDTERWKVVKVLAPTLQPLEADHTAARLVGRARHLARRSCVRAEPHPFA
jgi:ribosomal protein S12 methylthiotransferase accessory factor YcaO